MGNDIETKDKIEPQRTHPTRKAKTYDNNNFNIFCRQMGSGMSYSIEDAKSRYQCKRLTFSRMCRSRKLPYSPGHWEFMLVCSFPHPFWKFQFSCSLSTTNFSFQYHPPPPPPTPEISSVPPWGGYSCFGFRERQSWFQHLKST